LVDRCVARSSRPDAKKGGEDILKPKTRKYQFPIESPEPRQTVADSGREIGAGGTREIIL